VQPGERGGMGTVVRGNDGKLLFGAPLAIAGLGAVATCKSELQPQTFLCSLAREYQVGIGGRKRQTFYPIRVQRQNLTQIFDEAGK
jgi:hypothetical protein